MTSASTCETSEVRVTAVKHARKPWAVLSYVVADDRANGSSLDRAAEGEIKAICNAADFGKVSVAVQVDFKRRPGVFRATLLERQEPRRFERIVWEEDSLWRRILGKVEHSQAQVQMETKDLNAARAKVFEQFLRYGEEECPADRYLIMFYGHAAGPMGLFYDSDTDECDPVTLRLTSLADALETGAGRATIVLFRDCFMNTLETAYQLRNVS